MKFRLTILLFSLSILVSAQDRNSNYRSIRVAVKDSIRIDSVSINPARFIVRDRSGNLIDSSLYTIDFQTSVLKTKAGLETDSLLIDYLRYPAFITKTYSQLDKELILSDTKDLNTLYRLSQSTRERSFVPFEGLSTTGSISRGITVGNNQNSVLNSELDLQISGKLNDKVSLRASIQDANIPLQESGYSQRLDEFDQVFIEVFSKNWNIRAGDIDLINPDSYYATFSKRVQGLQVQAKIDHPDSETTIFGSGALVRGQFARSQFTAQEGNQGPYKLRGNNNELFVLIVSGSESVYVNGVLTERGETKDYIIDYNAGEIIFNSTFPITSEMRITVDYQFSDRNYSRLVAFGGAQYKSDHFRLGVSVYNENDAKNQPLQQNLSAEQVGILADAGDDIQQMTAPSAIQETFNENRILYKKELINGVEAFVFSNDPADELFSVKFTLVGDNQGNYAVSSTNAISTIYEYVEPVNGLPQGNYEPVVRLIAPTKLQMLVLNGSYTPSEKTSIQFELTGSNNDLNLFSNLDDNDNTGYAAHLSIQQKLIEQDSSWSLAALAKGDFIDENFTTIERLYNPEFNRDWNLDQPMGNQRFFTSGISVAHPSKGSAAYTYENLNFGGDFNGNRHNANADLKFDNLRFFTNSSTLSTTSSRTSSKFLRSFTALRYSLKKAWIGGKHAMENNEQRVLQNDSLTPLSQRFNSYEIFTGYGDSTNIYVEIGYKSRVNDSLRNNNVERVNNSDTYFLRSRLIKNQNTNLALFVNYRNLKFTDNRESENSLNSRLQFSQTLLNQLIGFNTVFETNSGTLPQQEFTYVQVEAGQGAYTWLDYNDNGIQELEEFELAQFQDQGNYIRVLLPNQVFVKTHQNRFSQNLTINPQRLAKPGSSNPSFWSRLYNQTSYLIDRKIRRDGNNFNLNPFEGEADDQLGLQQNFRNTLFFNRGKQRYTTSYTYVSTRSRSVLSVGFIENFLSSHQLDFNHKIKNTWLLNVLMSVDNQESTSENFSSKNFEIDGIRLGPKISYLLNDRFRFDLFYQFNNKDNLIGNLEQLRQQRYGLSFQYSNNLKGAINGELNYFSNDFDGAANSPVAYQMLEGLQPGTNFTWNLIAQKKITQFLDLNLTYFGRKSENSRTIHTGSIQLKAFF